MIVLAGVEPRHERAAPKSHIFQITRRAANYLKADRLVGERMELWSSSNLARASRGPRPAIGYTIRVYARPEVEDFSF